MWATVLFTDLTGLDASKCVTGQSAFHAGNSIAVFDRLCKGFLQFPGVVVQFSTVPGRVCTVPRRCCVAPCGSPWRLCSSPGASVQSPARPKCKLGGAEIVQSAKIAPLTAHMTKLKRRMTKLNERRSLIGGGALFASEGRRFR